MSGEALGRMRLSAPWWMWVTYVALVIALGLSPLPGLVIAVFVAGFSFQFWTMAYWRGMTRAEESK